MKISTQTCVLASVFGDKETVKFLCELGYDSLDYSFFDGKRGEMAIEQNGFMGAMAELRDIADTYGVTFNQTHALFASYKEGDDDFNSWVKPLIIKSIEASGILGAEYIVIHPFTVSKNQKQENMDFFNSLIPYAEKHNVVIAIENMFGYDPVQQKIVKNVCSDGPELCDYIDSLDSENICACIDIGHCGLVGENAAEMIRQMGNRLKCLHVHDNDHKNDFHTLPFTEKLDFPGIMEALRDIKYEGEITLEADNYLIKFPKELMKDASVLMYKTAKYIADL